MILEEKNGIRWLKYELLAKFKEVKHGVFLRGETDFSLGGTEDAHQNREIAKQLLEIPHLIASYQVHGKSFVYVDHFTEDPTGDALITNCKRLGLLIKHADCQVTILYDPDHQVIANVHCGWRGSIQNIYASVIKAMEQRYSTNPRKLIACVGPSLGPESAEFIHYRRELPKEFWRYETKTNYFNFWEITREQLKYCGILPHHMQFAEIDSLTHFDCFSHRRKDIGRNGTIVSLI